MDNNIYSFAKKYGIKESRVIDACSGISPLGPSKKVKAAVRKAIKKIGAYPDPRQSRLRKLFFSKYGLPEDCVLFADSISGIIRSLPDAFGAGKILAAGPDLNGLCHRIAGVDFPCLGCCEAPSFEFDPEKVRAGLGDIRALIISNPDRTTGRLIGREIFPGIIQAAAEKNVVVIVDETLMEFTAGEGLLRDAPGCENLVVLRTTANFYGIPGLELACAVSSRENMSKIESVVKCGGNSLAVEAAGAALKDKAYRKAVLEFIASEKRTIAKALKRIKGVTIFESDSNIFLVGLEERHDELLSALRRAGFFLGEFSAGPGGSFLSLSVMDHAHNLKFLRVVRDTLGSGQSNP